MKKRFTGIVVSTKKYGQGEMATLLTAEEGLVNILVEKNVEKPIFTYAQQLLTFGYYTVEVKGAFFYILDKCEIIDVFAYIHKQSEKLDEAVDLCNVVKEIAQFNDRDTPLFLEFINAIKALNYQIQAKSLVLSKFLSTIFVGFSGNPDPMHCTLCGGHLGEIYFLNPQTASFVCKNCQEKDAIILSKKQFLEFKALLACTYKDLETIVLETQSQLLAKLLEVFRFKVGDRFKFYSR